MKNKLFTLAAALTLAAVISGIYAAPALAAVIKAALVKNVDEPGRTPYTARLMCNSVSAGCSDTSDAVPAGMRLVVEHFSAFAGTAVAAPVPYFIIETGTGFGFNRVAQAAPDASLRGAHLVNQPMRFYVNQGEGIELTMDSPSGGNMTAIFTGYLVDLGI